jgi:ADP-heptose:LPS heptosyltransferase/tetratricopeptide (TPR) repeat protein
LFGSVISVQDRQKRRSSGHRVVANRAELRRFVKHIISRADAARDAKQYRDAAVLYNEALHLSPDNAAIHVQCGHMYKEAGDLNNAELHYDAANRLIPKDPDLALQLGHFYKISGRTREAAAAYERAIELNPNWPEPRAELTHLRQTGWRGGTRLTADIQMSVEASRWRLNFDDEASKLQTLITVDGLVPEIMPRKPHEMLENHHESIHLRRFGKRERSAWGMLQTFRGIEAIRGFCISSEPIVEVQIAVNGLIVQRGPPRGGYKIHFEKENFHLRKYVINIWYDFANFACGRYGIEVRFLDAPNNVRHVHREQIAIAAALPEGDFPDSDSVISLPETDQRSLEEQINSRASMVRSPKPALFARDPQNVLILRTDQLGDMVASVPAIRRLRELMPSAHFVGLLTSSNSELAETLNLFSEIIVVDFPDDQVERRRIMPHERQAELRQKLEQYRFDLAIDLADSGMSRPLLLLSGARFLYGFYDREWPWLSAGFEGNSHDPKNDREIIPHSTKVLAFVERLGAMLNSKAQSVRRVDLTRNALASYGISEVDRFAVLHSGGRSFARWPGYGELASRVLEQTDLKVLLLADDSAIRDKLTPDLRGSERFRLLEGRLPFDDLDALLSFCEVFVGNDSGPKHLAALRGAKVVSIHSSRLNWNEWGQEMGGLIISRKLPCAGCLLYFDYDAHECGKDVACVTSISVDEVFTALLKLLSGG